MDKTLQIMTFNDWNYLNKKLSNKKEKRICDHFLVFNFPSLCAGDISRDAVISGRSHGPLGSQGGEGGDVSTEGWREPVKSWLSYFSFTAKMSGYLSSFKEPWLLRPRLPGKPELRWQRTRRNISHQFLNSGHRCWRRTESFQVGKSHSLIHPCSLFIMNF